MADGVLKKISRLFAKPPAAEPGEAIAAVFLKRKGFVILERNFRRKYGEIDIICSDGGTFCFVEVKSRSNFSHGFPQEFIDRHKRRKLTLAALQYIREKRIESEQMRFDVVAVDLLKKEVCAFIKGAFDAEFEDFG